ncbi:TetR/AcrR family transcriptional regulator [Cognatishimia maritima]|uniref:Transcriptional regulator, TetR family n=1 Tax=Cognatishimia maritima TaxID=870908 RepID=A0A1M5RCT2_9RHOB|nr:TetR/AcrR family transcriptional regulator [Cognatishimia maritima]SHH23998.1 transcriptional regulator, TetR family [Cognatishimia maritima]
MEKTSEIDARDRILDAAEVEFAANGYGDAGMKAIATRAGVAQGLLHYHFKNKERLYGEMVGRRAKLISAKRIEMLDAVDLSEPDALERIFEAFFSPPLGKEGGGPTCARIFAQLAVGNERDQKLVETYYDAGAKKFIHALQTALGDETSERATWAYSFALGALIGVIGRDGRPERLMGKSKIPETDLRLELIPRLVNFAAGGARAQ